MGTYTQFKICGVETRLALDVINAGDTLLYVTCFISS